MTSLPALRILTFVLTVAAWAPVPSEDTATFNPGAQLDTSDVVFIPGERWCPQLGTWDEEKTMPGKCLVDLVEGTKPVDRSRPDWDHAMMACLGAGWPVDVCEESVGDGEF